MTNQIEIPEEVKATADCVRMNLGIALIEALLAEEPSIEVNLPLLIKPSLLKVITENLEEIGVGSGGKTEKEKQEMLTQGMTAILSDAIAVGIFEKSKQIVKPVLDKGKSKVFVH